MEGDDADDDCTTEYAKFFLLNAVMYTAQNVSEAAFLESVFFPNREREREREKVFRVVLLLLLREGDDDQY